MLADSGLCGREDFELVKVRVYVCAFMFVHVCIRRLLVHVWWAWGSSRVLLIELMGLQLCCREKLF